MKYLVNTDLSYDKKNVKAGEIVADIPPKSVPWLTEQGFITPADSKKSEPKSPDKGDK